MINNHWKCPQNAKHDETWCRHLPSKIGKCKIKMSYLDSYVDETHFELGIRRPRY